MTEIQPQMEGTYGPLPRPGNGMAVASLVLGLIGMALFCVPYIGLPCAILAIVFGFIGRKRATAGASGGGLALAGLILGFVTVALTVLLLAGALAIFGYASGHPEFQDAMRKAMEQAQQQNRPAP